MEYERYILGNGIRLIHKQVPNPVAHFGVIINTGSRDEDEDEHGLAHFIEHVLFKGTKKRRAFHILSRLEDVGGEINAYTTKEETAIHASFLKEDYRRAIDLISDILINSTFPEKEITKEKEVIIDEINSYKDNPSELIFDEFEEMVYKGDPIGRSILGSVEQLEKITRDDITRFISKKYNTDQIVLSSIGNIGMSKLIRLTEENFGIIPENKRQFERSVISSYSNDSKVYNKNTHQAHCVIGNIGYSYFNKNRLTLYLLSNLLGGPGLNSRLNLSLREKKGYTYNIESNYSPYVDTGLFNIYFGTEKENLEKSINLVNKELDKLKKQKLGTVQLSKAKKQLLGHIAISSENYENLMLSMGKSMLIFNYVDSMMEIKQKLDAIKAEEILQVSNDIFDKNKMSMLIYT